MRLHQLGRTNHPADPGGLNVKAMPLVEAQKICHSHYWAVRRGDDFTAGFDYSMFGCGVNSGIVRSGKVVSY